MTGWKIDFPSKSSRKLSQTLGSEGNRIAFLNIDSLMNNAILGRKRPDRRGGAEKMHVFYAPFYANGIDYIANITVRETSGWR